MMNINTNSKFTSLLWKTGFTALLMLFAFTGITSAQYTRNTPVEFSEKMKPVQPSEFIHYYRIKNFEYMIDELQHPVSISFENQLLKNVIEEIASQANLGLGLSTELQVMNKRFSFTLENSSAAEALAYVLADTDYEAAITRRREIIIVEKEPRSTASQNESETQYGTIMGEVRDALTGETLPGATVLIRGTTIGAATDIDGRFTLRRVPAGNQIIEIRYIGHQTQTQQVVIPADDRVVLNVELLLEMIEGDEVIVQARQRGQARALTRQRQSVNIRSVVDAEQIDRFADQTVSGSLQRIAGMGHGGTNIRGVGSGMSNVTMDGQRMGSTGTGDRSVNLETISIDMVQDLEVIKVITPDMHADALSGVINVNTRRPIGQERSVSARLGGGWNSRYMGLMGPSSRASVSYGDSPTDFYSYGLNFSYQFDTRAQESLSTSWDTRNFTEIDGPSTVMNNFRTEMQTDPRERIGAGVQFTFQPSERSTYHMRGMFNKQNRIRNTYSKRIGLTATRYTTPYQTGPLPHATGGLSQSFDTSRDEYITDQYTMQFGGRHLFDKFDMEYTLGWGHGRSEQNQYDLPFSTSGVFDYFVDISDRWKPVIEIAPHAQLTSNPPADRFTMGSMRYTWDHHRDNQFTGTIDLEGPFRLGTFKIGLNALSTFKSGTRERFSGRYASQLTVGNFDLITQNPEWRLFDRDHHNYLLPWIIDMSKARDFYHSARPKIDVDMESWAINSATSDYFANEHTFAGYGMSTLRWSKFTFLGGLRVEHSISQYSGYDITINRQGLLDKIEELSVLNSYTNLFPNAQVIYAVSRFTNLRLAYSRSIGRPNFSELSPYLERNFSSERIRQGNPHLKPMLSNNLEFLFEHYFMNVGLISAGLFYKELTDFVYSHHEIITPNGIERLNEEENTEQYVGWDYNTFKNGDEATVYGFEFSWQRSFDFLPGFLSNIGTYANYSYVHSMADIGRRNSNGDVIYARLQNQRPHVVNTGLDYSQGSFSGQVSYHWGAPSISSYGSRQLVPDVPDVRLTERVYFDRYRDSANDVSLTLRYRVTGNMRAWIDVTNLLNHRSIDYYYHRDYYPDRSSLSGRSIRMGMRYSL